MPFLLNNLGGSYHSRFEHLGEIADINMAIESQSQAIFLTPDGHAHMPLFLSSLGLSRQGRFESLGELADIDKAIECHLLAISLAAQGHAYKPLWLCNLSNSYQRRFGRLGELEDINKAIECQSLAISLTPDGHAHKPGQLSSIGISYQCRFEHLGELTDINKAVHYQIQAVLLTPDGHADKPKRLNNLGNAYQGRSVRLEELADIDTAIKFQSQSVLHTPDGHTEKPAWLNSLGLSLYHRFQRLGELSDIDRAIIYQTQAISFVPDKHADKPGLLNNFGLFCQSRWKCLGELADLEKAIKSYSQAISLAPEAHAEMSGWLRNLGDSYRCRFKRLGELVDINKAIEYQSQAMLLTLEGHADRPVLLSTLATSHQRRFERLGELSDIELSIGYFTEAAQSPSGHPLIRLHSSRHWARLSSLYKISSPLDAYSQAMALVPEVVWLGATVGRRYERITKDIQDLVAEAAAAAISLQSFDLALQWLEEGRSIVWSQMLQLRTPLDELFNLDPLLAQELKQVSSNLEHAASNSITKPLSLAAPSLEHTAQPYRSLAAQWEGLVKQARKIPGLHNFLRPKRLEELMTAAQHHAVVVLNVQKTRCDALVLLPGLKKVLHIPLPTLSYQKSAQMRSDLSSLQREGARTRGYRQPVFYHADTEDYIETVLADLWFDVAQPVLDSLGYLKTLPGSELPRLTWCTTGPLTFLPLHAAGDYNDPCSRITNYVISSYTPTVTALLKPVQSSAGFRGTLAVGQAATAGCTPLPGTVVELDQIQKVVSHLPFTRLDGDHAPSDAMLSVMEECSWVHLACHASQKVADPTASAFHLHRSQLDLATITRKSLKHAELAFLSACQTATGDERLPDEAVHLAAGMMMTGYPSVIATMWSIKDKDAPVVAEKVYAHMLEGGVADTQKAARALHAAVGFLRDMVGQKNLARWVPCIHIGL